MSRRRSYHPTFRLPLLASRAPSGIFAHPMRRSATITLLFSALLALAGCKSPCRELSERLCDCVEQFQRDECIQAVADRERNIETTDEELDTCQARLDTCRIDSNDRNTCDLLLTDEGKQACGLAR
ncbi:hypothetical protein [Archangium lansingense]|uniref:Lipoprotein n=1 Tax=Archangium lansingense TaxID=2995310 RepID=A0ABT3ZYL1_9BACT|nr:hypothetical protein [Archangium lansinium]MCY1074491.1 hypothetical protein [Archangium lansinium]